MTYETLIVEKLDGGVGIVTLNRPDKLNALNFLLTSELDDALTQFESDDDVRCVVITGSGKKAFSAGADIHEMVAVSQEDVSDRRQKREEFSQHIANYTKPIVGAINGLAYGAASLLASSLDIRIGCETTSFRFLAVIYGTMNATWTLPLLVGWPKAKELLYSGRQVHADEALRIGLLNDLVASEDLLDTAIAMARQIATNDPKVVQGIKKVLLEDIGKTWLEMYDAERQLVTDTFRSRPLPADFKAFLDRKRTE